jgi:Cof subfamily protein (haloacid dehalogenase superfamily)
MQYKALMLDIDGTIIPYDYQANPSKKLKEAIKKTQEKVTVSLVTGRSPYSTKRFLKELGIKKGYAVVDNGAFVFDIEKEKIIYRQLIEEIDMQKIVDVLIDEKLIFYLKAETGFTRTDDNYYTPYQPGDSLKGISMIFTDEMYTLEKTHKVMKRLSFPHVSVFRTRHHDPSKYAFNITHVKATKLHGVEVLAKKLGISRKEIIACGDGYNDYPLLMAAGLKVAMGNAIDDLKAIADYIAPTVQEDGVVDVIEKYILEKGMK